MRNTLRVLAWPLAALLTLALGRFLAARPEVTEQYYTRTVFPAIRWVFDGINGWLPFPLFYLLLAIVLFLGIKGVAYLFFSKDNWRDKLRQTLSRTFAILSGIIVLFYVFWGFNYHRQSIDNQLNIERKPLTAVQLRTAFDDQTERMLQTRAFVQPDTAQGIEHTLSQQDLDTQLRLEMERAFGQMGLFRVGSPRGRQPFWNGFLLRFGAAGIYNPFTGECNIDRGLPDLVKPYTLAHELCHGYGFGDEGTCNFLAYLALAQSPNTYFRYTAELDFWRELAAAYRKNHPDEWAKIWHQLPSGPKGDILQIQRTIAQYPEYFEAFRRKTYDQYLKAQGIQEGIQNYGTVIELVVAWRKKTE